MKPNSIHIQKASKSSWSVTVWYGFHVTRYFDTFEEASKYAAIAYEENRPPFDAERDGDYIR